jgi:glucosamine--fructose-6-phosphate aminotransferase (isomerizing)
MSEAGHGREASGQASELARAIRAQPEELARLAGQDFGPIAARLERRRRVWLIGTGSSQHVGELGALLLAESGLDARCWGSQEFTHWPARPDADDAVIVISHTGRSSFALAARELALSSSAEVVSITGAGVGWPDAIETVAVERSETYSVSVTAALMVLFRIAHELGAPGLARVDLEAAIDRVRAVIDQPEVPDLEPPARALVLVGTGAGAVSAREGALKLREAAHVLAEGYGSEHLLHGHAVPLERGDALLLVAPAADRDGLLGALAKAARAEGLALASIDEAAIAHPTLAQLPIIVRLQLLALAFSRARATNPDKVITGHWADEATWAVGRPG